MSGTSFPGVSPGLRTRELIELRGLRNEQPKHTNIGVPSHPSPAANWRWAVFASVLLCFLAVAGVIYWRTHSVGTSAQVAQATPVAVTIDLSQAGTTRGTDTTTVPAVVLPRRVDTDHVILPNFSPGGNYVVSVTTDRNGASEKQPAALSQMSRDITPISQSPLISAACRRAPTSSPRPMREPHDSTRRFRNTAHAGFPRNARYLGLYFAILRSKAGWASVHSAHRLKVHRYRHGFGFDNF
jgi:hypothetical protein